MSVRFGYLRRYDDYTGIAVIKSILLTRLMAVRLSTEIGIYRICAAKYSPEDGGKRSAIRLITIVSQAAHRLAMNNSACGFSWTAAGHTHESSEIGNVHPFVVGSKCLFPRNSDCWIHTPLWLQRIHATEQLLVEKTSETWRKLPKVGQIPFERGGCSGYKKMIALLV